jgi:hypothetical protein
MRESEEKTRNALKYLVRWEVVNIPSREKTFRMKIAYPQNSV